MILEQVKTLEEKTEKLAIEASDKLKEVTDKINYMIATSADIDTEMEAVANDGDINRYRKLKADKARLSDEIEMETIRRNKLEKLPLISRLEYEADRETVFVAFRAYEADIEARIDEMREEAEHMYKSLSECIDTANRALRAHQKHVYRDNDIDSHINTMRMAEEPIKATGAFMALAEMIK